jgi:hypothetical protein
MKAGDLIDINRGPYGMNGGTILSGSVSSSADAFWYYPITATSAWITFANLVGPAPSQSLITSSISSSFNAGVGVWGRITSVTQSSGYAILYSGSNNNL